MENFILGIAKMSVISENPSFPNPVLPKTSVEIRIIGVGCNISAVGHKLERRLRRVPSTSNSCQTLNFILHSWVGVAFGVLRKVRKFRPSRGKFRRNVAQTEFDIVWIRGKMEKTSQRHTFIHGDPVNKSSGWYVGHRRLRRGYRL